MPDSTKRILTDETGQDIVSALQSLQSVIDPNGTAVAAAAKIDNMTVAASGLAAGATPTATISEVSGHKHIAFGIPAGYTPQLSIGTVSSVSHGSTPTATLTGTTAAPVLNLGIPVGASGNETIDDTAGLNDDDLVWSADKVVKELASEHIDLTAGNAYEVLSDRGDTDNEPYVYRKSGGSKKAYNREMLKKIVGGTVAWNQMANNFINRSETLGITIVADNNNGTITVTGTATSTNNLYFKSGGFDLISGHVYLLRGAKQGSNTHGLNMFNLTVYDSGNGAIFKVATVTNTNIVYYFTQGDQINVAIHPQLFDLTQMFGSTIADYIYSLEQATAGAGVAWFRKLFPKDYYAYDAGTLMSVKTSGHRTVGFNQWDEEWEVGTINGATGQNQPYDYEFRSKNYIPVIPGATYNLHYGSYVSSSTLLYYWLYDSNKERIGYQNAIAGINTSISIPSNAKYVRFRTGGSSAENSYKNNICFNLSDPSKNGTYEPYTPPITYPLSPSLELRGIPKLTSGNQLYYDGDEYTPDGKVTRRYGIVDLGTLTWSSEGTDTSGLYRYATSGIVNYVKTSTLNYFCTKYTKGSTNNHTDGVEDVIIHPRSEYITIWSKNITTASDFKTSLSGVYLVYELATPTTESADEYRELEICAKGGTEEFIDERDVAVPVGTETFYPVNIFDYIDEKIAEVAALASS